MSLGPGRGDLTQRHMDKLVRLINREKFEAYMAEKEGRPYAG